MKKILFALVAVLTVFAIVRFNALQIWLLEHDYSWTMAKALPYVAVALLGIVLAYFFAGAFKLSSNCLKCAATTTLCGGGTGTKFTFISVINNKVPSDPQINSAKLNGLPCSANGHCSNNASNA